MSSTRDFLESSDYDNHDPFSFAEVGATVKGEIVEKPRLVSTQYGDRLILAVDTGKQTFTVWIKPGNMAKAVSKAVREAGRTEPEVGGKFALRYASDGVATNGLTPPKIYQAKYEAPVGSVPEAEEDTF